MNRRNFFIGVGSSILGIFCGYIHIANKKRHAVREYIDVRGHKYIPFSQFKVGEKIEIKFDKSKWAKCEVLEVHNQYLKCFVYDCWGDISASARVVTFTSATKSPRDQQVKFYHCGEFRVEYDEEFYFDMGSERIVCTILSIESIKYVE